MDKENKIIYLPNNQKVVVYPKKVCEDEDFVDDKILLYVFASNFMLCLCAALGALINFCFGFKTTSLYCIGLFVWSGIVSFISAKADNAIRAVKERKIANVIAVTIVIITFIVIIMAFPSEFDVLKTGLE